MNSLVKGLLFNVSKIRIEDVLMIKIQCLIFLSAWKILLLTSVTALSSCNALSHSLTLVRSTTHEKSHANSPRSQHMTLNIR